MEQAIFHISGFPGSGKTTLGHEIEQSLNIVVKDTDDFTNLITNDEFSDPIIFKKRIQLMKIIRILHWK